LLDEWAKLFAANALVPGQHAKLQLKLPTGTHVFGEREKGKGCRSN
jgi:hypothetical protein